MTARLNETTDVPITANPETEDVADGTATERKRPWAERYLIDRGIRPIDALTGAIY